MREEDIIRDKLSQNIETVNKNFTLIQKEYRLDNCFGTKGFIDILAKDQYNNYVIIEIKRSRQASREALHEIMKYASLLKQNLHVKDSEIRLLILSTDWKELLIPFSEYCNHKKYMIEGMKLNIDHNLDVVSIEKIEPIDINFVRTTTRSHQIFLYETKEKMENELKKIPIYLKQIGMENYVIFHMENHEDKRAIFKHSLYVVTTKMNILSCIDVLNHDIKNPEDTYNLNEIIEDFGDEEDAYEDILESYLSLFVNKVKFDYLEIGYPEKLMTMSLWKLIRLHRFGFFAQDLRLTDDMIMYECKGLDGLNDSVFYSFADSEQVSKLEEIKKNSLNCLRANSSWLTVLKRILEEVFDEYDKYSLNLVINNLDNILESTLLALKINNTLLLPNFELVIDICDSDICYVYKGVVYYNGLKSDFNELNNIIFNGDFFNYFILRQFNQVHTKNKEIMECLGLTYNIEVIKIEGTESDIKQVKLVDDKLVRESIKENQMYIYEFIMRNNKLIQDLEQECHRCSIGYI